MPAIATRAPAPTTPVAPTAVAPLPGPPPRVRAPVAAETPVAPPPAVPQMAAGQAWRVSGGAWALARGGAAAIGRQGTLGASQAGARVHLDRGRGPGLTAMVSRPLGRGGATGAVGVAWRGHGWGAIVEARAVTGAPVRPAIIVYGGVDDRAVGVAALRLDAFAEGGTVGATRFADGQATLTRPVASIGAARLDLGGLVAGDAQAGVARLEAGPVLVARGQTRGVGWRASAGWRARVAGDAAPASGPAVAVGIGW